MADPNTSYPGGELELFREARNWKGYLRDQLDPYLRGDVLEVGAGLGGTTLALHHARCTSWTCLEPDPELARELGSATAALRDAQGRPPRIVGCALAELDPPARYDAILYVDVLEHIEDDGKELLAAAARLHPSGHLVVVSPAHQWLFTAFDVAIGHHRRYSAAQLLARAPRGASLVCLRYLDSIGIAASLANRLLLRASAPTPAQLRVWDRYMVPVSRRVDAWFRYSLGKSILAVWQHPS